MTMIDKSTYRHPMAVINVDCLFRKGQTEALCMDNILCDLDVDNIDGFKLPDMSYFSAGVVARAQAKQDEKEYKKL